MNSSTKLGIKFSLIWSLFGVLFFSSCLQGTKYPVEPDIKFISATFVDSVEPQLGNPAFIGVITFSFTDGDGDIGVPDGDTTINMFVSQIGIKNGEWQTPEDLDYTIPYITPDGQNKSLKGEIDIDIMIISAFFPYDSIIYEIYIEDRNENTSNIITTPIIAL